MYYKLIIINMNTFPTILFGRNRIHYQNLKKLNFKLLIEKITLKLLKNISYDEST